jgi:hypothetical protein
MAVGKLVVTDRLIRHQDGRRNRIPGGITPEHFLEINRILETILREIETELEAVQTARKQTYLDDQKPKELHIRLNESDWEG